MTETLLDFAISRYERPQIADGCLRLQDIADADVNMLLTAAWLAKRGQRWDSAQVRELIEHCRQWREWCVLPLRGVRKYLKGDALYERVKALELDAEMRQLQQIEQALLSQSLSAEGRHADTLKANLQVYLGCLEPDVTADREEALRLFIDALIPISR